MYVCAGFQPSPRLWCIWPMGLWRRLLKTFSRQQLCQSKSNYEITWNKIKYIKINMLFHLTLICLYLSCVQLKLPFNDCLLAPLNFRRWGLIHQTNELITSYSWQRSLSLLDLSRSLARSLALVPKLSPSLPLIKVFFYSILARSCVIKEGFNEATQPPSNWEVLARWHLMPPPSNIR